MYLNTGVSWWRVSTINGVSCGVGLRYYVSAHGGLWQPYKETFISCK